MNTRILAFAAALTLAIAAYAQTSRGTVSGTVSDPAGATISGATIALTNAQTAVRRSTNSFDLSLFKSFAIGEGKRLEFRWEAVNAFNHPQFTEVPERDVLGTTASRFLNRDFTNSGIRSMWVQVKVLF